VARWEERRDDDLDRYALVVTEDTLAIVDRVAQAAGMVSVQADCPVGDAFARLVDRAKIDHCTIGEVATAVVERSIRLGE
jgi:AmiR/NasT family two-component response regulator